MKTSRNSARSASRPNMSIGYSSSSSDMAASIESQYCRRDFDVDSGVDVPVMPGFTKVRYCAGAALRRGGARLGGRWGARLGAWLGAVSLAALLAACGG